jgi:hypothetical protein
MQFVDSLRSLCSLRLIDRASDLVGETHPFVFNLNCVCLGFIRGHLRHSWFSSFSLVVRSGCLFVEEVIYEACVIATKTMVGDAYPAARIGQEVEFFFGEASR